MRNWPRRFTAEQCRSALRNWCLNRKEMKGLSIQGSGTGKSFSETLILESVNLKDDERLFIEFHENYKFTTCRVQILF